MKDVMELIDRDSSVPAGADFALVLDDDCLSPAAKKGQKVFISCSQQLSEGEAGVFLYQDRVFCRRWQEDYSGALILLPGRSASAEPVYIPKAERQSCLCLGKILL